MRFFVTVLAIMAASNMAFADEIPSAIKTTLKTFQSEEQTLNNGVFRVRLPASVVRNEVFRNIVLSVCRPLAMSVSGDKSGWKNAKIDRIEVVNQIGAQGFAYVGGRKACGELEQFASTETNAPAFVKNTWVCVAGNPCRQRRDGEVTSGDN